MASTILRYIVHGQDDDDDEDDEDEDDGDDDDDMTTIALQMRALYKPRPFCSLALHTASDNAVTVVLS